MKQILCSAEPKVGTIPFHSSHIPLKIPPALKENSLYSAFQMKNGKKRKLLFFFLRKKIHSKNTERGLEVSETANETWSINI